MKHFFSLFVASCIGSAIAAQPTIDLGNFGVLVGESFTINDGPWVAPGSAGAAQTWDLTGLTSDSVYTNTYVDPATTPDGASFPDATVALGDLGAFSYLEIVATGGSALGASIPGEMPVVYSDPQLLFAFPCTFNTTWNDPFHAEYTTLGFDVIRDGTAMGVADGYGTLMMPWGTLTDVLRVSLVWDWIDSTIFINSVFHSEFTYFLHAGTHHPIVELFSNTSTIFGTTTTNTGSSWLNNTSTAVLPAVGMNTELMLQPNPAVESIALVHATSSLNEVSSAGLYDGSGRWVRAVAVEELASMNVTTLDPGLYVLRIANVHGIVRLPFIKE